MNATIVGVGPSTTESLIVFSDVHLGSDIHDGTSQRVRRSTEVDRDLVRLLEFYRGQKPPADRWRIVIAGDFIDFIGMTVSPTTAELLETDLTDEEREHGIGSACDHARLKLRRVAERHADVFAELAIFVAEGHALTIVHGNHDIEFHWDAVKDDFRALLLSRAPDAERADFEDRIEFNPWFFYRNGVAYIEHGHQYDPFCATHHIMAPLSAADARRVEPAFCEPLLRYVVRPMGMSDQGHEHVGLAYYLKLAARLGIKGGVALGVRFARAILELFRLRRAHLSATASVLRQEHEARVAKLAEATRIGVDRLKSLLSLQAPPHTESIRGILAGALLDRLLLAVLATAACIGLAIYSAFHGHALWGIVGVLVAWSLLNRWLAHQRRVDPSEHLIDRATHLARLFPAAFVVMGHTHVPTTAPAGDSTYVNLGSWAEDANEEGESYVAYRAPRTHLVIHVKGDRAEAQFCTWKDDGPAPASVLERST